METSTSEEMYKQLLSINNIAFEAGNFNCAYHALMSALYIAQTLPSDDPLLTISQRARDQLAWIDRNNPEYEHSSQSAQTRLQTESIFTRTSKQAETIIKLRHTKDIS